jgi:hypothetical protein
MPCCCVSDTSCRALRDRTGMTYVDDGLDDGDDAVHDGHEAASDRVDHGVEARCDGAHCCGVVGCLFVC